MGRQWYMTLRAAGRLLGVAAAGVFWLLAQVMAFSPELHHWLHETSESPQHHCAAVVFQQGQIEPAPSAVQFLPPSAPELAPVAATTPDLLGCLVWLPPGRAPPHA
jgi:hypothetical protein